MAAKGKPFCFMANFMPKVMRRNEARNIDQTWAATEPCQRSLPPNLLVGLTSYKAANYIHLS